MTSVSTSSAARSRTASLDAIGQAVWLDFISRKVLRDGTLRKLIKEDGVQGVTSNPTIFDKAIRQSTDYDAEIGTLAQAGKTVEEIYTQLTIADIREALDLFRPLYDLSEGLHGYVSLEVSPKLAHDTEATIAEAERLWRLLDRPNAMIKIPGTVEGLPAVEESLAKGINVNITLLFAVDAYRKVAEAYLSALERRAASGKPIDRIASVASFFVSRIDTKVDKLLDAKIATENDPAQRGRLAGLKGQIAVANAKEAYALYQDLFNSRFEPLRARGARVQRLLWASVGTKNPAYSDVLYIDELIGPDTVSTMPPETLAAFLDHGTVRTALADRLDLARRQMADLEKVGISMKRVTDELVAEGVASFATSFDELLQGIAQKRAVALEDVQG
jgi:transaldolase